MPDAVQRQHRRRDRGRRARVRAAGAVRRLQAAAEPGQVHGPRRSTQRDPPLVRDRLPQPVPADCRCPYPSGRFRRGQGGCRSQIDQIHC